MYEATPDLETRVAFLFMYQNGLAPIDVSELRIEHLPVEPGMPEEFVFFQLWREKTDVPVFTCLSPEIVHDLKLMLRLEGCPKRGFLFHTSSVDEGGEFTRLREDVLSARIKEMAKILGPERYDDFQSKDLRDAFNVALLEADLKDEIKDVLMGHRRKGARAYSPVAPRTIEREYRKVYELIKVNHRGAESQRDKEREEIIDALIGAMLKLSPDFVREFERLGGLEPGTVETLLESRMTVGQLVECIKKI